MGPPQRGQDHDGGCGEARALEAGVGFAGSTSRQRVMPSNPSAVPNMSCTYLVRYTHRVAISNHRLLTLDDTILTEPGTKPKRGTTWDSEAPFGLRKIPVSFAGKPAAGRHKLAPKREAEDLHRQEEGIAGMNLAGVIARQTARRNHADMGMAGRQPRGPTLTLVRPDRCPDTASRWLRWEATSLVKLECDHVTV
jgi:Putative transposase